MFDSRELFSKEKLKEDDLINAAISEFGIKTDEILIVNNNNDWLKKDNQKVVFQYNGLINEKEEEYYGYYYYDIFIYENKFMNKLKGIVNKFNSIVIISN